MTDLWFLNNTILAGFYLKISFLIRSIHLPGRVAKSSTSCLFYLSVDFTLPKCYHDTITAVTLFLFIIFISLNNLLDIIILWLHVGIPSILEAPESSLDYKQQFVSENEL